MPVSQPLRAAAAVVLGAGAAFAAWQRVGEIRPYLEIEIRLSVHTENFDLWDVNVTARGGETIEEVRVEPLSPRMRLLGPGTFQGLKSGWKKVFRLELSDPADTAPCFVRVSHEGPGSSTSDLLVGGGR